MITEMNDAANVSVEKPKLSTFEMTEIWDIKFPVRSVQSQKAISKFRNVYIY